MNRKAFTIRAIWDPEAGVFYSESDNIGLHVEAKTLDAFEDLAFTFAPELIVSNHLDPKDAASQKRF